MHSVVNLVLYIICIFVTVNNFTADGCGVTTHNVIAHRATHWYLNQKYPQYSKIILKHQDAFQNGAAFPDWGYACVLGEIYSNLSDASEYTHWPPFQSRLVNHIRKYYPQPWSESTEKLISFFLGIISHDTADILWHDLPKEVIKTHQGFIQSMANVDYNKAYATAHTEADVGGEFMCAYEIDLSFLENSWYLPSKDLAQVFVEEGFTEVTPLIIDACNLELYAEVHAIKELPSQLLYPHFAAQSPFLVDQFQDWWIGGVDDMAVWTNLCWDSAIDWIENGVDFSKLCLVEFNDTDSSSLRKELHQSKVESRRKLKETFHNYKENVAIVRENYLGGTRLSVKPKEKPNNKAIKSKLGASNCVSQIGTDRSFTVVTDTDYSQLGGAIVAADFNNDGFDDVAIGAPMFGEKGSAQRGAVYVIYGRQTVNGHQSIIVGPGYYNNATTYLGPSMESRFGSTLGAVDFNLDNYVDLIVSVPGTQANTLQYSGELHIYFGGKNGLSATPDIVISSTIDYANFGFTLKKGDVSGDGVEDLIIGNPYAKWNGTIQVGQLLVFFSSTHRTTGQQLTDTQADLILIGESESSWFGYDTAVATTKDRTPLLIVSAPQFSYMNNSVGKIYGFDISEIGHNTNGKLQPKVSLKFAIQGVDVKGHLGQSLAVGNPFDNSSSVFVAFSLPTVNVPYDGYLEKEISQAGMVYLMGLDGLNGNHSLDDLTPFTVIRGNQQFARLGWDIEFIKQQGKSDSLLVSSPWRDSSSINLPSDGDSGAAFLWEQVHAGTIDNAEKDSTRCIISTLPKSLTGKAMVSLDFNGDSKLDLVLGSPRDSSRAPNAGSVNILFSISA